MKLLRVVARLRSPYIGRLPHLDGILALSWVRRHGEEAGGASRKVPIPEIRRPRLHLAKLTDGKRWVWAATAGVPLGRAQSAVVHQTRRRDAEDWGHLTRPVKTTAGPSKDCLVHRDATITADGVEWWCVGPRHEVRKALKLLWGPEAHPHGFVGSVRRAGAGEIASWSIEGADCSDSEALSMAVRDGIVMRHLPASWADGVSEWDRGAWRSPYWHPDAQESIPRVGSEARLCSSIRTV